MLTKRSTSLISLAFLISLCLPLSILAQVDEELNIQKLEFSITKGIDFLYKNQLPYGEFKTYASSDKNMQSNCYFDSSPFVSTFVLYSISFSDDPRVESMTKKASDFFLQEMDGPGIWRYYTKRNNKRIQPDLDDTACISYFLKKKNIPFASNTNIFLANRNEEGLFYTWLSNDLKNDIDPVVNADILFYLGENKDTKKVCDYLNYIVLNNKEEDSMHYCVDKFAFYYVFSRAYSSGARSLELSKDVIINKIISKQKEDGSFGNELSTALALCTLLNFEYRGVNIDVAIKYIFSKQMENGSWARYEFFIDRELYYGSEELTTAICIEALSKYRNLIKQRT